MRRAIIGVFHLHSYNRTLMCSLLASEMNYEFVPLSRWDNAEVIGINGVVILEPELLIPSIPLNILIEQIDSIEIPALIVSYTSLKLKSKRHNVFKSPNNPGLDELVERINLLLVDQE